MMGRLEISCLLNFLLFLKVTIAQEPSLTLMPEVIRKNLGEAVVVSCTADVPNANLVTNMEWRTPNNELIPTEDDSRSITTLEGISDAEQLDLFIRKLKVQDVGTYECSATYAGNQKLTKSIKVESFREIDFQDTEVVQTPVLNSDAKIRCVVTSDPSPHVDWLKDGVPIKNDNRIILQNDGILIKGITEHDEGVYRCRARVLALGEIKFKDIQVEVHVKPEITGAPKDTSGVEKESVAFQCIATGKPAPHYTWVNKDSEVLNDKEGYFVDEDTGELRILDLRPDHGGLYRCTAKNAAGEAVSEANLRVLMKPKVEQYLNITVSEGEDAEMRCLITGDPLPDAVFQKETNPNPFNDGVNENGRIIVQQNVDDEGRRVGVLKLNELSRSDDGLYTCSAVSSGGETVVWGHVTVEFVPSFEDQPLDEFWSWEQKPVNLSCLATSIPNATIKWFLREQPIREEDPNLEVLSRGPNGVLRVHPLDGSYFDKYTCEATNTLGKTEHDVLLKRVQKPGPVSSTQVEKTTATTIQWSIRDPLDDGGLPVLGFTVQFRLADTAWDKNVEKFWSKGSSYVVDHLTPMASYVFRFAARNDAGDGEWSGEKSVEMPKRSYPEEVLIFSVDQTKVNTIPYTDHYELQWQVPLDNGEEITFFEIIYYPVRNSSKGSGWEPIGNKETVKVPSPGETTYKLEGLSSNSFYKIELRARNKIGLSRPSEVVIKTAYDPSAAGNELGSSVKLSSVAPSTPINAPPLPVADTQSDSKPGLVVGIIIIGVLVLLVIVDVILFFAKNIGVTAFLARKMGAQPNEKDKEAMIEEGSKQSAKPDDNLNKEVDKVSTLKEAPKEKEATETTPMITGETDKEAIKKEEKEKIQEEGVKKIEEEEEEEEEDDEEGDEEGNPNRTNRNKKKKLRPMSFSGMGDLKAAWEQKQRREEMSQSRKEDISRFRQMLCAGKNSSLKEKFESLMQEGPDEDENRNREEIKIDGKRAASSLKKRFEQGQPFILEDDDEADDGGRPVRKVHVGSEQKEVEEIFKEAETAKKARNVFKHIDSKVSQEGNTILRSQSFASTGNKENRRSLDDMQGGDDSEVLGRDPNLIKCTDNYQDDVDCRNTKNILQMFKKMEMGDEEDEEDDEGPRPLKRFTPPPEGEDYDEDSEGEYSDEEYSDEEEEEEEDEEDEEGNKRPKLRDELLQMANPSQSARKAANLRAKFERWESDVGHQNELNSKEKEELEECMPSLDTAKNLRAMFETKAIEVVKPVSSKPITQKVNRFVGGGGDTCVSCSKTVYAMEKLEVHGKIMHKNCFKCHKCQSRLSMGSFSFGGGDHVYCTTHYKQLFTEKGSYEAFTEEKGKWTKKIEAMNGDATKSHD